MMVLSSFGQRLKDYTLIKDAVAKHATVGVLHFRHEGLYASYVSCQLLTNLFTQEVIVRDYAIPLKLSTSIILEIVEGAVKALKHVYRSNIEYAKVEVNFGNLELAAGGR